jgi:plasmid maintenance system antidote protein VapI
MDLKEYFTENCTNITKWCRRHKLDKTTIHNVLKGKEITLNMAMRIYRATNRQVTPKDLGVDL